MRALSLSFTLALSLAAFTGCDKGEDLPAPPSTDGTTDQDSGTDETTGVTGGDDTDPTGGTDDGGTDDTGPDDTDTDGGADTNGSTDSGTDGGTDDTGGGDDTGTVTGDSGTDGGTDGGTDDTATAPLPCAGKTTGYDVGDCAVDFTLYDYEGIERSLYDYAGQVILLDFSAFW